MTEERTAELWPLARALHEARIRLAWGPRFVGVREPWPEWHRSYLHHPIAYVDLALAQAEIADDYIREAVISALKVSLP